MIYVKVKIHKVSVCREGKRGFNALRASSKYRFLGFFQKYEFMLSSRFFMT